MIYMKLGTLECGNCKKEIRFYQLNWVGLYDIPRISQLELEQIPSNADEATRNGIVECFSCGHHNDIFNPSNGSIRTV